MSGGKRKVALTSQGPGIKKYLCVSSVSSESGPQSSLACSGKGGTSSDAQSRASSAESSANLDTVTDKYVPHVPQKVHTRFFAIMVDEVTFHNTEFMPLCIRFWMSIKIQPLHSPTDSMYTTCLFL